MSHTLTAAPPFEFGHSLAFISGFAPTQGEQRLGRSLVKVVRVLGRTVQFTVRVGTGTSTLGCDLATDTPLSAQVEAAALDRVRFYLGLDDDLGAFYQLAESDPPFQPVLRALSGYHQVKFLTPFENAAWAILTQRTPVAVARGLKSRLTQVYGGQMHDLWAFPDAADLAAVPEAELAATLGNARKAAHLASTARAFTGVDEGWLRTAPYDEVRAWLLALPGIGPWSALFVLLRGLGRGERVFGADNETFLREIGRAAEPYYGPLTDADLRRIAERYGPWQGYWAHHLRAAPALERTPA